MKLLSFNEYINNKLMETKLIDLFDEYPDEEELIWNFVGDSEFKNMDFVITSIDISEIITPEYLDSYKYAKAWQKKLVKSYMSDIDNVIQKPIIVDLDLKNVIDGYHRLMAMYLSGIQTIKIIDINQ